LPGAMQIAAQSIGKTTAEFANMMANGEVISEDFLPRFADALEDRFGTGTDAVRSFGAETARMKNAWDQLLVTIGNAGPFDALGGGAGTAATAINWLSVGVGSALEYLEALGQSIGRIASAVTEWDFEHVGDDIAANFAQAQTDIAGLADEIFNADVNLRQASEGATEFGAATGQAGINIAEATAEVAGLAAEAKHVETSVRQAGESIGQVPDALADVAWTADQAGISMTRAADGTWEFGDGLTGIRSSTRDAQDGVERISLALSDYDRDTVSAGRSTSQLSDELERTGKAQAALKGEIQQYTKSIRDLRGQKREATQQAAEYAAQIRALKNDLKTASTQEGAQALKNEIEILSVKQEEAKKSAQDLGNSIFELQQKSAATKEQIKLLGDRSRDLHVGLKTAGEAAKETGRTISNAGNEAREPLSAIAHLSKDAADAQQAIAEGAASVKLIYVAQMRQMSNAAAEFFLRTREAADENDGTFRTYFKSLERAKDLTETLYQQESARAAQIIAQSQDVDNANHKVIASVEESIASFQVLDQQTLAQVRSAVERLKEASAQMVESLSDDVRHFREELDETGRLREQNWFEERKAHYEEILRVGTATERALAREALDQLNEVHRKRLEKIDERHKEETKRTKRAAAEETEARQSEIESGASREIEIRSGIEDAVHQKRMSQLDEFQERLRRLGGAGPVHIEIIGNVQGLDPEDLLAALERAGATA
jgi:predicted  nucleic acid-binding Zn-ribbon protein